MDFNKKPPIKESMDYRKFIDTLYAMLITLWGEEWGRLVMKRPNVHQGVKDVSMPIITYVLKESKPGIVGQSGNIERSPRHRENIQRINRDGEPEVVQISGQIVDHYIEFTIYAQNNKEAMEVTQHFMEVMDKYKGYLMKKGMQNMWFQREYERNANEQRRDDMSTRGVDYLVRLERLTEANLKNLEELEITADTVYDDLKKQGKLPSQKED